MADQVKEQAAGANGGQEAQTPKTKEQVRAEAIKAVLGPEMGAEGTVGTEAKKDTEPKEKPADEKKESEKPKETAAGEGAGEKPKEQPAPEPKDEQLEKSWSAIVRRDREIQLERKQLKEQAKELEELRALEAEVEEDPVGFAYKRIGPDGITKLTARAVAGGKPAPEEEAAILKRKTDAQTKELEESRKSQRETEIASRVSAYRSDLEAIAKQDGKFPLVRVRDAVGDALNVAVLHAQETGEVMDHAQALQMMEEYLADEIVKDHKAGNLTERELKDPAVRALLKLDEVEEKKKTDDKPAPKSPGKEKGHAPVVKSPSEMNREEWRQHCLKEAGLI
jgi:hypothetical protein